MVPSRGTVDPQTEFRNLDKEGIQRNSPSFQFSMGRQSLGRVPQPLASRSERVSCQLMPVQWTRLRVKSHSDRRSTSSSGLDGNRSVAFQIRSRMGLPSFAGSTNSGR